MVKQGLVQRVRIQASGSLQSPLTLHRRGGLGTAEVNSWLVNKGIFKFKEYDISRWNNIFVLKLFFQMLNHKTIEVKNQL